MAIELAITVFVFIDMSNKAVDGVIDELIMARDAAPRLDHSGNCRQATVTASQMRMSPCIM